MREPEIIHLGQVCIDMTLSIDHLPERGGDIFASSTDMSAGGGFNVLYAARQMGATAAYMGARGTGPMADIAQSALDRIGVRCGGAVLTDMDTGVSIAMTEPDGERTFVSTRGAETHVPPDFYEQLDLVAGDVIYLSGYSLMHVGNAEAIRRFAGTHEEWAAQTGGYIVFDPSPVIGDVSDENLTAIYNLHPIWSVNEREARMLCERFRLGNAVSDGGDAIADTDTDHPDTSSDATHSIDAVRCSALAAYLHNPVIVRVGPQGAWYCDGSSNTGNMHESAFGVASTASTAHNATPAADTTQTAPMPSLHIPSPHVHQVDANGAGDTHAGVLCAALLEGQPIIESIRLANCAAALSVTHSGPATCPTRGIIDEELNHMG